MSNNVSANKSEIPNDETKKSIENAKNNINLESVTIEQLRAEFIEKKKMEANESKHKA